MTTEVTHLTHTVSFSRKVNDGNYGSNEATVFLQFDTPLGVDPTEIIEKGMDRFAAAKAIVFDQLGIEYHIVDGIIIENLDVVVAQAKTERAVKAEFSQPEADDAPSSGAQGVGPTPPYDPKTTDPDEKKLNRQWAKARYETHPGEFWDNRPKKARGEYGETSADFTHKDSRVGFYA